MASFRLLKLFFTLFPRNRLREWLVWFFIRAFSCIVFDSMNLRQLFRLTVIIAVICVSLVVMIILPLFEETTFVVSVPDPPAADCEPTPPVRSHAHGHSRRT